MRFSIVSSPIGEPMDTGGVADAGRAVRYPLLRRPRGIRRRRIGGFRRPAGTRTPRALTEQGTDSNLRDGYA